ncbi:hypothetical protein [Arthrobacter sp. JSM 101049]|uniref:hypothetical protein n=1 Tax=Arthrobacter sp. JSM 101049 TaxID=929097 RepID=UPI00356317EF
MNTRRPAPITRPEPTAPDADWEDIRTRILAHLAAHAAPGWTDHNTADPGITLAEAAAYALADLHYRTGTRRFEDWPLEVRGWAPDADRHWDTTLPAGRWDPEPEPGDPAGTPEDRAPLTSIADALADPLVAELERLLHDAESPADAAALLSSPPYSGVIRARDRAAVAALLRTRMLRRIAHDEAGTVAAALTEAARTAAPGTPAAAIDAAAAAALAARLPLWEPEAAALVRRERRRRSREILMDRLAEVRTATADTAAVIRGRLAAAGLDPEEAELALAAAPDAAGMAPEDLEDGSGHSLIWPPHPIQALTCEPATAADYARRARTDPRVARAWAVPGRLEGIAWNGLPTGTLPSVAVDPDARALTLVLEAQVPDGERDGFLRQVLAVAIGPESTAPFPEWREDVDDAAPRRLLGDEVGAALLVRVPVLVQATLVTAVGVPRETVIEAARERIAAFFAGGRAGTPAPAEPVGFDGPWPRADQPAGGWTPGEPIRFTEVTAALVADPHLWGVENLALRLEDDAVFTPAGAGALDIPGRSVPVLAAGRCLRVRYAPTGGIRHA